MLDLMKSLKVLDRKLQWLAKYARFQVNINSVIGTSKRPEDAVGHSLQSDWNRFQPLQNGCIVPSLNIDAIPECPKALTQVTAGILLFVALHMRLIPCNSS